MQHFKAIKESTYGSRMVKAGEIIVIDDAVNLDATIWQAVSTSHAQAVASSADVPMGMNTDPRLLNDYSKLQDENAKLHLENAKLAELTEQHTDMVQQVHGLNILRGEQKSQIDNLREELASKTQLLADKEQEFVTCMQELQAENASLKQQLAISKKK